MIKLEESNFILYAAANYQNTQCYDTDEFYEDLNRFKYVKRLFSRYHDKGELKERLILNHLITLYNVFEHHANTRMLFFKTEEKHWPTLKMFLLFLNYMPEIVHEINGHGNIIEKDIPYDFTVQKRLKQI